MKARDGSWRIGQLSDVPRLVWAWVGLQVVSMVIGLFYPSPAWAKVAEIAIGLFFIVYFVRARRWAWWLVLVVTALSLVDGLSRVLTGNETPSAIWSTYSIALSVANLALILAPSVRRYFREWRKRSPEVGEHAR